jgi:Holliday junction resolvase
MEIKTIRGKVLYINEEQINGLIEFAQRIGYQAILGVKFKRKKKGFLFLEVPEQLQTVNKSNNYKVTFTHACGLGLSFGELIGEYHQKKLK